jgi:integrase
MTEVSGRALFGSTKTHAHRSVSVPRFLRDDLAQQLAGKAADDMVFTSPAGSVLRIGNWRRQCFDRAARDAGLNLTPHELRHTAASLAIASGASIKSVQRMLGHKSAVLTLDLYGHLYEDDLDLVAERLHEARAPRVRPETIVTRITKGDVGV